MATEPRGEQPGRRPRRRGIADESDTPFSEQALAARSRDAVRAYRCSVYGLVPGVGLLLGPVAVVLGLLARRRALRDPGSRGLPLANAAVVLGGLIALTNWLGLVLMILGLRQ